MLRSTEGQFTCDDKQERIVQASSTPGDLPQCKCSSEGIYTCQGDDPLLDTFVTNTSDRLIHVDESYNIQDYLLSTFNYYKAKRCALL